MLHALTMGERDMRPTITQPWKAHPFPSRRLVRLAVRAHGGNLEGPPAEIRPNGTDRCSKGALKPQDCEGFDSKNYDQIIQMAPFLRL